MAKNDADRKKYQFFKCRNLMRVVLRVHKGEVSEDALPPGKWEIIKEDLRVVCTKRFFKKNIYM